MNRKTIFSLIRYGVAPLSGIFIFVELAYITVIIHAIISLLSMTNIYGYNFEKDDRYNYLGGFLVQVMLVPVAYYSNNLSVSIICATAALTLNLFLLNNIRKKMGWKSPFSQKDRE